MMISCARLQRAFILIELLIVVAVIGALDTVATPTSSDYMERTHALQAVMDTGSISKRLTISQIITGKFPNTLAEINHDELLDPWGNSYQYLNLSNIKGKGKARKDHKLVPINYNYDLYNSNKDDRSVRKLKDYAIPVHSLELEITKSVLMDDTEVVLNMLHRLQDLAVQLSIDNFGTGYSSMSDLEQLPIDTLKIDMSFVRKIQDNGESGTIAATIIAMAHTLNKSVVAEGVETKAQLDFLSKLDCVLIQGYHYNPPSLADELLSYIRTQNKA